MMKIEGLLCNESLAKARPTRKSALRGCGSAVDSGGSARGANNKNRVAQPRLRPHTHPHSFLARSYP
jgi:hypothetical protein